MSAREVARAEAIDEAEIQGLLARDDFRALVESWREFETLPPEEQTRRLVILARQAIANALADWDVGAAFFVLREDERAATRPSPWPRVLSPPRNAKPAPARRLGPPVPRRQPWPAPNACRPSRGCG
ncbi:MAG TPA: hypothetical protein VFY87_15695 [Geminicoccaceae bacterium]|nr:hypothetical protein [Geminicoccaceae bacterium]